MILALTAALAAPVDVAPRAVETWITNAHLIDASGERVGPFDVHLRGGLISEIAPGGSFDPSSVAVAAGLRPRPGEIVVIPADGDTLVPGLIDAHVHVGSAYSLPGELRLGDARDALSDLLWAGVTTALDCGGDPRSLRRMKAALAKGAIAGPDLRFAGSPFTAPDGHPLAMVDLQFHSPLVSRLVRAVVNDVATVEDVRLALEAQGPTDFLKVMLDEIPAQVPVIGREPLNAVLAASFELGRPLLAHTGRAVDMQRGLDAGITRFVHAPYATPVDATLAYKLAAAEAIVAPTIAVWDAVSDLASAHVDVSPVDLGVLDPARLRAIARFEGSEVDVDPALAAWVAGVAEGRELRRANVRMLREAGVTLVAGSDGPNLATSAGGGLFRELLALESAGLTRSEVLRAATVNGARLVRPDGGTGQIAPGFEADLLLVDGDPTEDLTHLARLRVGWTDGRSFVRR